ncbi:hypothetical protein [Brevibacterium casei]|uniref:hypothetical protein n=1 Tax=Brevibacterium casei TaxID=33889 RepID=UPI00241E45A3|nr:hypothetical protein [Brevibacterium casei]
MALQNIPWAIGGGAENDVEGARLALYAATKGGRGIMAPRDLRVSALPTPGGAVRIHAGAAVTPNDYPGGAGQSYAVREISSTDFPVPATGSSGGAVRFLIIRINDEQYAGAKPTTPATDPRNAYQWVSALPTTVPHVPLVKLDQPANTATITNAMLTDIRQMADPKILPFGRSRASVASDQGMALNSKAAAGEWFPGDGTPTGARQEIYCPPWASAMYIEPSWYSVIYSPANVWGRCWINYGLSTSEGNYNGQPFPYNTQEFAWDAAEGRTQRQHWLGSDYRAIPASMRGQMLTFAFRARRHDSASGSNVVRMDALSGLSLKGLFFEVPDPSTE